MPPPRPPSRRHHFALLALALAGACGPFALAPARAEVFKCAGPQAVPVYQDTPCPPGKELRNFQTDPPPITVLPGPEIAAEPRAPAEPKRGTREVAPARGTAPAGEAKPGADAAERKFVRPGMSEGEVVARLGRPEVTSRGSKLAAARWTYLPSAGDPDTITTITFANGVVASVERKVSKR
ncbi:MAG: DUF4124 domain-containing protein [Betaproteobacteria bacterium]|nr:DUF4124 domain-containing protein [Betaproteobacteria bacterium]